MAIKEKLEKIKKSIEKLPKKAIQKLKNEGVKVYVPVGNLTISPEETRLERRVKALFNARDLAIVKSFSYQLLNNRTKHIKISITLANFDRLRVEVEYRPCKGKQAALDIQTWSNLVFYIGAFIEGMGPSEHNIHALNAIEDVVGTRLAPHIEQGIDLLEECFDDTTSIVVIQKHALRESIKLFISAEGVLNTLNLKGCDYVTAFSFSLELTKYIIMINF